MLFAMSCYALIDIFRCPRPTSWSYRGTWCPRVGSGFSSRNAGSLWSHSQACNFPVREATNTVCSDQFFDDLPADPVNVESAHGPCENSKRRKHTVPTPAWKDVLRGDYDGVLDE